MAKPRLRNGALESAPNRRPGKAALLSNPVAGQEPQRCGEQRRENKTGYERRQQVAVKPPPLHFARTRELLSGARHIGAYFGKVKVPGKMGKADLTAELTAAADRGSMTRSSSERLFGAL